MSDLEKDVPLHEKLHAILVKCANDLEALHPMNGDEPCLVYSAWVSINTALAMWKTPGGPGRGLSEQEMRQREKLQQRLADRTTPIDYSELGAPKLDEET